MVLILMRVLMGCYRGGVRVERGFVTPGVRPLLCVLVCAGYTGL